jgi:haloalkane dehalogenase
MTGTEPYGHLQFREINGRRMAYVDEGSGDTLVFQHVGGAVADFVRRCST